MVLSIQSDVVYGHVGNGAARPVLNALGVEVLALPSVLLAHHPGHAPVSGRATPAGELVAILDRLESLGVLDHVDAVLSGYLVDPAQVGVVIEAVERVRRRNPAAAFWCDPVLGDLPKGLYVAEAVAEAIRDHLVPRADLLLPNLFEAAWLSGMKIETVDHAILAARTLGPPSIIVTSLIENQEIGALWWQAEGSLFASSVIRPNIPGGLGDAFAALLLGLSLSGMTREDALGRAVAAISDLLAQGPAPGWPAELPIIAASDIIRTMPRGAVVSRRP